MLETSKLALKEGEGGEMHCECGLTYVCIYTVDGDKGKGDCDSEHMFLPQVISLRT